MLSTILLQGGGAPSPPFQFTGVIIGAAIFSLVVILLIVRRRAVRGA